jgi:hypothetical protein
MKRIYLLSTVLGAALILVFLGCKKNNIAPMQQATAIEEFKTWLHTNGGIFKEETISLKTNETVSKGKLNWDKATKYQNGNGELYDVPFEFGTAINTPNKYYLTFKNDKAAMGAKLKVVGMGNKVESGVSTPYKAEYLYDLQYKLSETWVYDAAHKPTKLKTSYILAGTANAAPTANGTTCIYYSTTVLGSYTVTDNDGNPVVIGYTYDVWNTFCWNYNELDYLEPGDFGGGNGGLEDPNDETSCTKLTEGLQNAVFAESFTPATNTVLHEDANDIEIAHDFELGTYKIPIWVTYTFYAHNKIYIEKTGNVKKFKDYTFGETTKTGTSLFHVCTCNTVLGSCFKNISADKRLLNGRHDYHFTTALLAENCPIATDIDRGKTFYLNILNY